MSQAAAQQPSRKKAVISLLVLLALTCIIVFTFKDHWAEITAALAAMTTSRTIGTKNRTIIISQSGSAYSRPRLVCAAFALDLCTGTAPALLETLDMFLSPLGNYCEMVITESECNPMSGLRGRRTPKPRQHTAFIRYVVMKEEKE